MTDDLTTVPEASPNLPNLYAPPAGMRWGLWEAGIALLVFVMVSAVVTIVAITVLPQDVDHGTLQLVGFITSLLAYGGLALVIVIVSRRLGLRSLARDFGLRFRPVDLLIGLAIGVVGRIATVILTIVAIAATGYEPESGNLVLSPQPIWLVLNGLVIAVIVAPVVEELFFRGLLLRAIRNRVLRWKGREQPADAETQKRAVILAIAISSVAFMALHLYQSSSWTLFIILAGSTLVVGVLNAFVAILTHRLGGAIVGHVVFNGSAVLLGALALQG